MARKLDRRTVLRGLLGGAAVSMGLPALEIFLDDHGEAHADGTGFPTRFGLWFFGNGVHSFAGEDLDPFTNERILAEDSFRPKTTGDDWVPNTESAILEQIKSDITIVSGLDVLFENTVPHGSGPAGVLSGRSIRVEGDTNFSESKFRGQTLDQTISQAISPGSLVPHLEVGAAGGASVMYTGDGVAVAVNDRPLEVFQLLFGDTFAGGEGFDEEAFARQLVSRRSVLDVVKADATALEKRLGKSDKIRLEQHFESIRSIENQITLLESSPPRLDACMAPGMPLGDYPDVDGRPQITERHRVLADMVVMVLACDITRVASIMHSQPVGNPVYPQVCVGQSVENACGHHELTHNEPGNQPTVQGIIETIFSDFIYFVNALKAVQEGDATLLDHSSYLCTTDNSNPKAHSVKNYPLVLAGSAGGALRMGTHWQSPGAGNVSSLGMTLLHAMGIPATEFGEGVGLVTSPISDLLV